MNTKRKNQHLFFWNLFLLAKKRLRSREDYIEFQHYQAREVLQDMRSIFNLSGIDLIVDFGCGKGGYTECFSDSFTEVIGLDLFISPVVEEQSKVTYVEADLLRYQLKNKADLIFCASVIEHISKPESLINNINKNLNTSGYLYLSFPPFYSIGGGHQVKPFHYLPEKTAISLAKKLDRVGPHVHSYNNLFGKWGLYKRSIDQVWQLLEDNGFEIILCKPRFLKRKITRRSWLKDFLTWHVEFYCQKR